MCGTLLTARPALGTSLFKSRASEKISPTEMLTLLFSRSDSNYLINGVLKLRHMSSFLEQDFWSCVLTAFLSLYKSC